MLNIGVRFDALEEPISKARSRSTAAMGELFLPLYRLLSGGGDPRLTVDPASGVNAYGCRPFPCPDTLSFASSTATSISRRAYDRAAEARQRLMRSAIAVGIDAAFDARVEAMRGELKAHLGLSRTTVDVVFSPSGTDSQLHALFLAQALLGPELTTVIVAADQTGSGTPFTARGQHFSAATANGAGVRKGEPIAGLAHAGASVALALLDAAGVFRPQAESDAQVLSAVDKSIANGSNVVLQIMDSSKLGWRAPSDECLDEISMRWPGQVQIVVDACQMRLGRARLQKYLDRGYLVIVTGSKFFTGPAFSGALLVPAALSNALDGLTEVAPGLCEYARRSDWPKRWQNLRSRFPLRTNLGQWLRWEAALEEIRAYYNAPDAFRLSALTTFGDGVQRIMASSPSLRPLQRFEGKSPDDDEFCQPTIFPFTIQHDARPLSLDECGKIHRALSQDSETAGSASEQGCAPEIAARVCLIGQPVALGHGEGALRISASARLVSETWSSNQDAARANLQRELGHVGTIVSKIEWLLGRINDLP
jgi:hypothetical protein